MPLNKLDLQYFAEDTGAGDGQPAKPTEGGDPTSNPQAGGDKSKASGTQRPEPAVTSNSKPADPQTPKVDAEAIVKKAQAELLKQLGISDVKTAKANLKAYQDYRDSQKSETEKQAEKIATYEKSLQEKEAAIVHANAKVSALSKGVKADAVDDVIKLVSGADDVDKAIDSVLAKYPQFGAEQTTENKPKFGQQKYNGAGKDDPFIAALGLKKKE